MRFNRALALDASNLQSELIDRYAEAIVPMLLLVREVLHLERRFLFNELFFIFFG